MNMRHYIHKTDEARRGLIIRLGLPRAYHPGIASSVRVRDIHIKYQGEARPGDPLRIDSGVLELGESTARFCHVMTHRDGRIAATLVETVEHVYLPEDRVFAWPKRVRENIFQFTVSLPAPAKARNIDTDVSFKGMSLSELEAVGAKVVGAGVFDASELDITNRVTMGSFFGRTTSTVGWFREGWPEFDDPNYVESGKSGALLEMRAVIHRYPRRGDAYVYLPALTRANVYTRELVHNVVDPLSGLSWVSMEASGCKFDLKARKLIKMTRPEITVLEKAFLTGVQP